MCYKVVIDMRYVENPYSGLSRFSTNIFYKLLKNGLDKDIFFILLFPPKRISQHLNKFYSIKKSKIRIIHSYSKRGLQWKFPFLILDLRLYFFLRKEKVNIFLSPYIDPPLLPGIKVISTIHDLIFLNFYFYFNNFRVIKRFFSELRILLTLFYSEKIITVSKTSKNILIERYKFIPFIKTKLDNITVIYNGISKLNKIENILNKDLTSDSNYFLYVGDRRNHKNLIYTINLVNNYNISFKKDLKLYIAGSKSYKNLKLQKHIDANIFVKEIINPSDQLLDSLYEKCIALILLSFDEGFGIPVIEAASRSKRIVVSDIPIFNEIAPKNSLLLDLDKKDEHIHLLHNYLKKQIEFDSQTILKKWSWDLSALRLKDLINSILINK